MWTPPRITCAGSLPCWSCARAVKDYIDLQLVAFPQDGLYRTETGRANLLRALDMGVDVVGGIPHFERTMQEGADSLVDLCRIAAERGLMVDIHCDETDDPLSRHIETLARETLRHGLGGRVAGSHLTSMHSMDNYYVSKLLPLIAEAGVSAIPNPLINIVLQGRHDSFPKRRGLTRVKEMQAHGIAVGWGQDCVLDPWYSLGTGDMLDVAFMGLHVAQMTHPEEMARCFTMVTETNAQIIGLEGYGLKKGAKASLVVLDAANPTEAVRLRPARLAVVAKGKIISRSARGDATLSLPGRPGQVRRRHAPALRAGFSGDDAGHKDRQPHRKNADQTKRNQHHHPIAGQHRNGQACHHCPQGRGSKGHQLQKRHHRPAQRADGTRDGDERPTRQKR